MLNLTASRLGIWATTIFAPVKTGYNILKTLANKRIEEPNNTTA